MKVLSVIIPSYNTELYLERCLDSLIYNPATLKKLDIIVVNDGSSDGTMAIAQKYALAHKSSISVIDKPNGGHGSTINSGLSVAKGTFVKILDSDDWFNIVDLPKFVEKLEKESADIIITNYRRDILYSEKEQPFIFTTQDTKKHPMSDTLTHLSDANFFFMFSMPSMAIRTESLRRVWGDGLLEHAFYVDQQFVAKVLLCAKTYRLYNLDIYRHFIGRPDQSIAAAGFFAHRHDHERVLKSLFEIYYTAQNPTAQKILKVQINLMLKTHDGIYSNASQAQKAELSKFRQYITKRYPEWRFA